MRQVNLLQLDSPSTWLRPQLNILHVKMVQGELRVTAGNLPFFLRTHLPQTDVRDQILPSCAVHVTPFLIKRTATSNSQQGVGVEIT